MTTDYRALIAAYVAGDHRPTRTVDLCLDPDAARAWRDAAARRDAAQAAVDDLDDTTTGGTIGESTASRLRKALKAAQAAEERARAAAQQASVRMTFRGLPSTEWTRLVDELNGVAEADRGAVESLRLPTECLSAVTTIDDDPIDGADGRALLEALTPGDLTRCHAAALEACTEAIDIPF